MPTITFATCSESDQALAIPLILSSGPESFRYVFSVDYADQAVDFLHHAYAQGSGQFGYANHLGLYVDGQLTGIGAYWTRKDIANFTSRNITLIIAYFGLIKGIRVLIRGMHVEKVMPPPNKNAGFIANLGVASSVRGQGLGKQLIEQFLQRARLEQQATIELDVLEGNPARNLYERLGFRELATYAYFRRNDYGELRTHSRLSMPAKI